MSPRWAVHQASDRDGPARSPSSSRNWKAGIFWGTGIFMVATAMALAVSWIADPQDRHGAARLRAVFVAIFGALTLWLHSDLFIKVKVTLINALFGAMLLGGVIFGKSYLKLVMGEAMKLPEEAWRTLTIRWGVFFFAWRRSTRSSGATCRPMPG